MNTKIKVYFFIASVCITLFAPTVSANQHQPIKSTDEKANPLVPEITKEYVSKPILYYDSGIAVEKPVKKAKPKVVKPVEPKEVNLGEYTVTAYCSCEICCGDYAYNRPNGIVYGAYGIELKQGVSVASPLPEGTRLKIESLDGEYIVQDTTADWVANKYSDRIIDVYFSDHQDAVNFTKKHLNIYQVKED